MTQQALLLIVAIVAFGLTCLAVGYWAGASRAFQYLGYSNERLGTFLATLLPSKH